MADPATPAPELAKKVHLFETAPVKGIAEAYAGDLEKVAAHHARYDIVESYVQGLVDAKKMENGAAETIRGKIREKRNKVKPVDGEEVDLTITPRI